MLNQVFQNNSVKKVGALTEILGFQDFPRNISAPIKAKMLPEIQKIINSLFTIIYKIIFLLFYKNIFIKRLNLINK